MSLKNLQVRDPQSLTVHPELKKLPALSEQELVPIRAGMKHGGERIPPINVDEEGRILDDSSRTHWLCAKARQLREVVVCIHAAAEVHLCIIRDLACRRHLSKSAIAYLAQPHMAPAMEAARMAKLEKLRKSPENAVVASGHYEAQTAEELAEELGVDRKTLFEAQAVRKAFADTKKYTFNVQGGAKDGAAEEMTLRDWFEPKLLRAFAGGEHEQNRPMGLGSILAGITAVREGNRDKFNPKNQQQLHLFENKVDFVTGWKYWTKLTDKDRQQHFKNFEDRLELLAEPQREELAEYFDRLAKKCRKVLADGHHKAEGKN